MSIHQMLIGATGQEALVTLDSSTFWLNATNPATLFKDSAGTPVSADGDSVRVAQDALGRAYGFGRASATVPTYEVGVAAASSALGFAGGADRYLGLYATSAPGVLTGSQLTWAQLISGAGATICMAISIAADATNRGIISDSPGGYLYVTYVLSAGNALVTVQNYDGTADTRTASLTQSTWLVFSIRHSGGTLGVRTNAGAWSNVASGNTQVLDRALYLGRGFSTEALNGHVAQLATWNSGLSDDNLYQVEKFIGASVGLSL